MNLSKEQRAQLEKKSGIRVPEKDIILKGGINQHLLQVMSQEHDVKPYKDIKKELGTRMLI